MNILSTVSKTIRNAFSTKDNSYVPGNTSEPESDVEVIRSVAVEALKDTPLDTQTWTKGPENIFSPNVCRVVERK